mmetsp:Transcript_13871/g.38139  ORF Transcript_13871/g.38139 Transcript_13871/m.38139 type:complete len:86 (-) Transcript_13871:337-594(-)
MWMQQSHGCQSFIEDAAKVSCARHVFVSFLIASILFCDDALQLASLARLDLTSHCLCCVDYSTHELIDMNNQLRCSLQNGPQQDR